MQEKNDPKISIIIIHYNTPKYLKTCFDSIFSQTYKNIETIFIDNNSPDKAGIELVKEKYGNIESLKIIENKENIGYARAANQGIKLALESENPPKYVVITNPDIIYSLDYFEKIIERIEKDQKLASITGKVYKYDFENMIPTDLIDTTGLSAYKNRRVVDRGQGLQDKGQFDEECEVFGISGACPLYRVKALTDVKIFDEYFDEDFFMYKEDVDLSWRFLLFGWKNFYYPAAVAYHGRGTGVHERFTAKQIFDNRKNLTKMQKQYSFRNQCLTRTKNEMVGTFFADFFPIMIRKIITPFYILICEPYLMKSWFSYLKNFKKALKKRKLIMRNKKISTKEMRKWFK